jgi:hypothetical protein
MIRKAMDLDGVRKEGVVGYILLRRLLELVMLIVVVSMDDCNRTCSIPLS